MCFVFLQYGGNPVSMAIANAVLDIIEDEDLLSKAEIIGDQLMGDLQELKKQHTIIGDVR